LKINYKNSATTDDRSKFVNRKGICLGLCVALFLAFATFSLIYERLFPHKPETICVVGVEAKNISVFNSGFFRIDHKVEALPGRSCFKIQNMQQCVVFVNPEIRHNNTNITITTSSDSILVSLPTLQPHGEAAIINPKLKNTAYEARHIFIFISLVLLLIVVAMLIHKRS